MRTLNLILKRLIDICGSLFGLVILSPLFIIIAISIKLTSEGPVIFKQERLGKDGKVFKIYKFRTMVVNAENIGDGLTVKSESDSRITKVGRILRKTSLDELPQLINVLIGQMSLVGPRPPLTYHPYNGYENYPEWAKKRFKMRPGITGLAQVTVRASLEWDGRMVYDVKYVDDFNILLDIRIMIKTVRKIISSDNIYFQNNLDTIKESSKNI